MKKRPELGRRRSSKYRNKAQENFHWESRRPIEEHPRQPSDNNAQGNCANRKK
jgi:hypothetical protein